MKEQEGRPRGIAEEPMTSFDPFFQIVLGVLGVLRAFVVNGSQ
jgi:hypothetical protein